MLLLRRTYSIVFPPCRHDGSWCVLVSSAGVWRTDRYPCRMARAFQGARAVLKNLAPKLSVFISLRQRYIRNKQLQPEKGVSTKTFLRPNTWAFDKSCLQRNVLMACTLYPNWSVTQVHLFAWNCTVRPLRSLKQDLVKRLHQHDQWISWCKIPAVKFHQQKKSKFCTDGDSWNVLSLSNVSWKGLFGFPFTAMPVIQCSDVCQGIIYIADGGGHII